MAGVSVGGTPVLGPSGSNTLLNVNVLPEQASTDDGIVVDVLAGDGTVVQVKLPKTEQQAQTALAPVGSLAGSLLGDQAGETVTQLTDGLAPVVATVGSTVDQVTTPTLVIHSELDFRCPLEQATRYYAALKRTGTEAEMLIFPGENHELTRSGQPRHRVQRFDAVLDWWKRHLPVD